MNKDECISKMLQWSSDMLLNVEGTGSYVATLVVNPPWSAVFKIDCGKLCYYLKQTPPNLYLEPQVISLIKQCVPNAPVPKIFFTNDDFHCFVMNSCGGHSLREKFTGKFDANLLLAGLIVYIKIMRQLETNISACEAINVPDWSTVNFTERFVSLLENRDLLFDEGLLPAEIERLERLVPPVESMCKTLFNASVNDTLVNCDFNENNMIFNEQTKDVSIIDWGEVVVAHPFFSLASFFRNITRRYKLDINSVSLELLKQKCLSRWVDVANIQELYNIYKASESLLPIFTALSIERLQVATNGKSRVHQRWFIGDSLRDFFQRGPGN